MEFYFLLLILICVSAGSKTIPKVKIDYDELCKTRLCVPKCCKGGYFLYGDDKRCAKPRRRSNPPDLSAAVPIYTKNLAASAVLANNNVTWVPNRLSDKAFKETAFDDANMKIVPNYYLTEEGILYTEEPNTYNRWKTFNGSQFCVDLLWTPNKDTHNHTFQLRFLNTHQFVEKTSNSPNYVYEYGSLISIFFLALLLVVYSVLQELRNLSGKVLMAYVSSLLGAFLLLFVLQVSPVLKAEACKGLTYCIYFLFLASFCWMNVMSCDIWWTFRGYAKARPIHRRGENFKFGMYCIYAWGLPAALTVLLIVTNEINLRHKPWILKPNILLVSRFIEGPEKALYLYTPMLILILCNWVFFLMTAFNIWRLHRDTAVLDSAAAGTPATHRSQKYRFLVYLKLSVMMGISWVMEVASSFSPNFKGWYISDIYNILIGLFIFLIFVCKKEILRKLKKRLGRCDNKWTRPHPWNSKSQTSHTIESESSTDTPVCKNPKGPAFSLSSFKK